MSLTMQKISMPTTVGKFRNSFLSRNERHPAAVQQWSNEVRLCTISLSCTPDHYDATVNGELLVRSSRTPFTATARVLLDRGIDSNSWLIMRHRGSEVDALRGKVGVAARLTVKEPDRGRAHFARYVPFSPSPVKPPCGETANSIIRDHLPRGSAPMS